MHGVWDSQCKTLTAQTSIWDSPRLRFLLFEQYMRCRLHLTFLRVCAQLRLFCMPPKKCRAQINKTHPLENMDVGMIRFTVSDQQTLSQGGALYMSHCLINILGEFFM